MIQEGQFWVLTLGKRYVRNARFCIVGQNLQHAERHATKSRARSAAMDMQRFSEDLAKNVRIWKVVIEEAT